MSYVCYSVNITAYHQHYSSTLGMPEEAANEAFKVYMTRKTQRWFRRWGCSRPSDTDSSSSVPGAAGASYSPVPGAVSGAASGGAVGDAGEAVTPDCRAQAPVVSEDDENTSDLLAASCNEAASPAGGGPPNYPRFQDFSPLLSSAKLACAGG